jgi:hypothetical protein
MNVGTLDYRYIPNLLDFFHFSFIFSLFSLLSLKLISLSLKIMFICSSLSHKPVVVRLRAPPPFQDFDRLPQRRPPSTATGTLKLQKKSKFNPK